MILQKLYGLIDNSMIDKIIRLAEINSAEGIIGQNHIGDELRKERIFNEFH